MVTPGCSVVGFLQYYRCHKKELLGDRHFFMFFFFVVSLLSTRLPGRYYVQLICTVEAREISESVKDPSSDP